MSRRKDIRNAIKTALTGTTSVGTQVMTSRHDFLFAETYPLILIFTPEEALEEFVNSPPQYARKLTVNISAVVEATASIDDALDDLGAEIDAVMNKDQTFGGLAHGTTLQKISSDMDPSGEKLYGVLLLSYEVIYVE